MTARFAIAVLAAATSAAFAQGPAPTVAPAAPKPAAVSAPAAAPAPTTVPTAPTPAAPPSPVSGIRNKISAGDLSSAESILEVHRRKNGEDGPYLTGLSWLARGALLLGEREKAAGFASDVRARCAQRIAKGETLATAHDLEIPLGAAIEVEAQLMERAKGARSAAEFVRAELGRLPSEPVSLRSRLNKRINLLTLEGTPAPELVVEDFIGERPPSLASLRGKPVVLYLWAEWCGDARAQNATLGRIKTRHAGAGLQILPLTRYYEVGAKRITEKARVDSMWKADYAPDLGALPIVFSTASMERYGGSSTPTIVIVDRAGIVRRYTPTRLTEAEFDRVLEPLLR